MHVYSLLRVAFGLSSIFYFLGKNYPSPKKERIGGNFGYYFFSGIIMDVDRTLFTGLQKLTQKEGNFRRRFNFYRRGLALLRRFYTHGY